MLMIATAAICLYPSPNMMSPWRIASRLTVSYRGFYENGKPRSRQAAIVTGMTSAAADRVDPPGRS